MSFLSKQFIDVIQWTEPEDGILAYRYPMEDMEIQNGGKLTVRDSQMAVFVNEGRIADVFGPGLYTLTTQTLPILTYLMNWDKAFKSPFKSDVYFLLDARCRPTSAGARPRRSPFATRNSAPSACAATASTPTRSRTRRCSTRRSAARVKFIACGDLEGQLRNTIVARMTDTFAQSAVPFLDMAANQQVLGEKIAENHEAVVRRFRPVARKFVVENISLPDELQKMLDQRISMNMIGDMGKYTQFQVAQSMPMAAANEGGGAAGSVWDLGAGMAMGQTMMNAMRPPRAPVRRPVHRPASGGGPVAPAVDFR